MTEANQECGCAITSKSSGAYVYALGTIAPRPPNLSIENELRQAIARLDAKGLTDRQAFQSVLSKPENRYLVRQLCWVFSVGRIETYILSPRDPGDFALLVDALRPNPSPADLDLVIGVLGPVAPAEACGGLQLPIVGFDLIYSFDRKSLVDSIPRPDKIPDKEFGVVAEEVLDRILQLAGNTGATDEHRVANYIAVRYPGLYGWVAEAFAQNKSLTSVEIRPSPLSGARKVLRVVLTLRHRTTDFVEKVAADVDATGGYPFLVNGLAGYYEH